MPIICLHVYMIICTILLKYYLISLLLVLLYLRYCVCSYESMYVCMAGLWEDDFLRGAASHVAAYKHRVRVDVSGRLLSHRKGAR